MKNKKLFVGLVVYVMSVAVANAGSVVLSKRTVELNVDISTTKLKLSRAEYVSPVVKVLVPELADVTILDHRNTGEGAPCLATYETMLPEDVIQNNPDVEKINFEIILTKHVRPNTEGTACIVHLDETVDGMIRGFQFSHNRVLLVGERHIEDCR